MGMIVDSERTWELWHNGPIFVWRYKLLLVRTSYVEGVQSFHSYYQERYIWQLGRNDAKDDPYYPSSSGYILSGAIHVLPSYADAIRLMGSGYEFSRVIRVKCIVEDLKAVGAFSQHGIIYDSEAYKKVYVESFDEAKEPANGHVR